MHKHAVLENGQPVEYTARFHRDAEGNQTPLRGRSADFKRALNPPVYEVERDMTVPAGHAMTGTELVLGDGVVIEQAVYEPMNQAQLAQQVKAHRDQLISAGSSFPVTGLAEPIPLTGRAKDQGIYLGLLMRAQGYKAVGETGPVMTLRDGDDVIHSLTPDQMIELVSQAMSWFEDVMKFSWSMIDGQPPFETGIPADFGEHPDWP